MNPSPAIYQPGDLGQVISLSLDFPVHKMSKNIHIPGLLPGLNETMGGNPQYGPWHAVGVLSPFSGQEQGSTCLQVAYVLDGQTSSWCKRSH